MEFMTPLQITPPATQVQYGEPILLVGSCFTEHIGNALADAKLEVMQNPHGILFDPESVCKSLVSYVENRKYTRDQLFQLNEVWNSWDHHSRFSHTDPDETLNRINASQQAAHEFLKKARWIIITLGSSYSYRLTTEAAKANAVCDNRLLHPYHPAPGVANCHRAPANWFQKHLLDIEETVSLLDNCYHQLLRFNPQLEIIFTVSPVRHLRDGVVANNRSKARLIEAVHHLTDKFDRLHYFPAYELVVDVLRDYRFYDIDLAHPNYAATEFVLEKFVSTYLSPSAREIMAELRKIMIARRHRPQHPGTNAHQQFLRNHLLRVKELQKRYPALNLEEELNYFSQGMENL